MVGVRIMNAVVTCKQEKELVIIIIDTKMKLLNAMEKIPKHGNAMIILKRVALV